MFFSWLFGKKKRIPSPQDKPRSTNHRLSCRHPLKENTPTEVFPIKEIEKAKQPIRLLPEDADPGRVILPTQKTDRLGAVLLRYNMLTYEKLQRALTIQGKSRPRKFLGEVLVDEKMLTEEELVSALSRQFKIPYLKIDKYNISKKVIKLIPQEIAKRYLVCPVNKIGPVLMVAMSNPANLDAVKELKKLTGCNVRPVIAKLSEIKEAIQTLYNKSSIPLASSVKPPSTDQKKDEGTITVSELPLPKPPAERKKDREQVPTPSTTESKPPAEKTKPLPATPPTQPSPTTPKTPTRQPGIVPLNDEEFAAGLRTLATRFGLSWEQKYQRDKISKAQEVSEAEFDFFRSL